MQNNKSKKVLILCGDGINCEAELARAFSRVGGAVTLLHVSEFLERAHMILDYDILGFPGGFSFGDELRSGKILAEKIRTAMQKYLSTFLSNRGLMIGICNGFQVLAQLGVFENQKNATEDKRFLTLATNNYGEFRDFWSHFQITEQAMQFSPWFKGLGGKQVVLPVRNKEGRLLTSASGKQEQMTWKVALQFPVDVNGSIERASGIIDETGQILGLMPHPEAALESFLYPQEFELSAQHNVELLLTIFRNAVEY